MTNIELFIINALAIQGIHFAVFNLFHKATMWYVIKVNNKRGLEWTAKPLFKCAPCMSSLWGIGGFYFTSFDWYLYPLWVLCLAGTAVIFTQK